MKIELLAVGKCRDHPIKELLAEYGKRLQYPFSLKEIDGGKRAGAADQEKLLCEALPKEPHLLIALDERGKSLSSEDFAAHIEKWRDTGPGLLVFCIGGADGFSDAFRQKADFLLSFGKQTWPHMLVRVMMLEQLYRAQQILAGHPYHRS
jgi:23S rRNA (pseudouridine1915-N3)-methyltransferase